MNSAFTAPNFHRMAKKKKREKRREKNKTKKEKKNHVTTGNRNRKQTWQTLLTPGAEFGLTLAAAWLVQAGG